jgi:hypothetical protein
VTNHLELMRLHVDALFTSDANGDLLRVNEQNGIPAPRFFVGRTAHGLVRRFRHNIDAAVREKLEAAVRDDLDRQLAFDAPIDPSRFAEILGRTVPVRSVWAGPAFSFPEDLPAPVGTMPVTDANAAMLEANFRSWIPDVAICQPMIAVTLGAEAVSLCSSVRVTTRAHEAGVETAPAHRGRGYAVEAVTAWARAVRASSATPLYSTSWTNEASRAVARKLGLIQFGSDLHVT